jgi:hypothetical protein
MATIEQAQIYNAVRQNIEWENLTPTQARTLLTDAEDYIRSVYKIRPNLTAEEGRMFDQLVCRLAATFQTNPPHAAPAPAIKSKSSGLGSMKSEVEYFEASSDPYPRITALVRPFLVREPSTGGVRISRMSR